MTARHIVIVPHTHWDREWYKSFEAFRVSLVELVDSLLPLLEGDGGYAHFMLDGQMAVVDDYLEVRPECEDRIRNLAVAGRLSVGPWYVLMDEFLVSGETIVRDLQLGLVRGAAFGGTMEVGYLPDMFGHIAQMPQILHLAGLDDAVVWRGVPSEVTRNAFVWEAPDGSAVRAEYLPVGYGNGAALPDDAKALVRRTRDTVTELTTYTSGDVLCMNGSDHLTPQPWLGRVVAEANDIQDEFTFEIASLDHYLARCSTEGLTTVRGELRSGARANMLMGVTSNRVDVKRRAACAERQLERRAEPLSALLLPPSDYPERLLELAWREMIRNSAHDSICACSIDEVVDAVLQRYAAAHDTASALADRAVKSLARSLSIAGPSLLNPASRARSGVVEVVVPADGPAPDNVQVLSERIGLPGSVVLDANTVRTVLGMLQGPRISDDAWVHDVRVEDSEEGIDITVSIGTEENPDAPIAEAKQDIYTRLGARPDAVVRVAMDQPSTRRIVARTAEVPGFGWRTFTAAPLSHPVAVTKGDASVLVGNGLVTVEIDRSGGTFALNDTPGYARMVDGGDLGDSYNFSPPNRDSTVDAPDEVAILVDEHGPVRSKVRVVARYRWPDHVDGSSQARVGEHTVEVETQLELRADDPVVRLTTIFVNPSGDHRLRVHLPLPEPTQRSDAGSAFGVVTRGLSAEGRPDEFGLPTAPASGFVRAGRLTVAHEGVCEYELVDIDDSGAHTLALTALRATGMLSRLGMAYRPFPAGPLTPVEGLQMRGQRVTMTYALELDCDDPYRLTDDVFLPLEILTSLGGGSRPPSGSELTVHGAEVSALHRVDGVLELRVFNPAAQPTVVSLPGRSGWLVDLRGRPLESFEESFDLRPFGIATARLRDT